MFSFVPLAPLLDLQWCLTQISLPPHPWKVAILGFPCNSKGYSIGGGNAKIFLQSVQINLKFSRLGSHVDDTRRGIPSLQFPAHYPKSNRIFPAAKLKAQCQLQVKAGFAVRPSLGLGCVLSKGGNVINRFLRTFPPVNPLPTMLGSLCLC